MGEVGLVEAPEQPVAVGGSLTAELMLDGLRRGWFVIPTAGGIWTRAAAARFGAAVRDGTIAVVPDGSPPDYAYTWWSPHERFVIPSGSARLGRALRRQVKNTKWRNTINACFAAVVQECGRDRQPRWITERYVEVAHELFDRGWAYSAEVWEGDELIGGAFGLSMGRVVTAESLFHRRNDASKICMVEVSRRATEAGALMLDLQRPVDHGRVVGGREASRDSLLEALAIGGAIALPMDERPAAWLLS